MYHKNKTKNSTPLHSMITRDLRKKDFKSKRKKRGEKNIEGKKKNSDTMI